MTASVGFYVGMLYYSSNHASFEGATVPSYNAAEHAARVAGEGEGA